MNTGCPLAQDKAVARRSPMTVRAVGHTINRLAKLSMTATEGTALGRTTLNPAQTTMATKAPAPQRWGVLGTRLIVQLLMMTMRPAQGRVGVLGRRALLIALITTEPIKALAKPCRVVLGTAGTTLAMAVAPARTTSEPVPALTTAILATGRITPDLAPELMGRRVQERQVARG